LFQHIVVDRRSGIFIRSNADLVIVAGLRKSTRKNITSVICESFNDCLINFENSLIISHICRDLAYGIKKVVNVDLINIESSLIFLSLENYLSCYVFAIFRQSDFMHHFLNLDYKLTEFLLIILFSLRAILNSVNKEGLDFISNSLSQLYHSIKNLTLICESKSFKNRAEITDSIINARNSLISAYTNEFLSRSHDIAYRYGIDNIDVKVKKWKKEL
jgi:hypothetical protein